jgi:hypothetical protein
MDGQVEVVDDRAAVVRLGDSTNDDDRLDRLGERCDVHASFDRRAVASHIDPR